MKIIFVPFENISFSPFHLVLSFCHNLCHTLFFISEWQNKRGLVIDLDSIESAELAKHLRKFYAEVKTKDGNMMSPSGLRGLRAALHRTITSPPLARDINILSDREFNQANKMLDAICKTYVQKANVKPKHHPSIENGDLRRISQYINSYKSSPETLLHCFWFLLCYNFARRGGEGWRELSKESFGVAKDDQGKQYLFLKHTEKKNWQGGSSSKAWDYSDIRAYGINVEGVSLNIVEAFQFYISKLHPECSALFQKPKYKKWGMSEDSVWFDNVPLGINKINVIMKTISESAHLSKTYTNHSVRATAITVMYRGGVDTKQICKISKHKAEETLKHYIDDQSSAQKRFCSEVLSSAFQVETSAAQSEVNPPNEITTKSNPSTRPSTQNLEHEEDQPILPSQPISNTQVYNSNQSLTFPLHLPQTFNFNVSGGTCNFHFHLSTSSVPNLPKM